MKMKMNKRNISALRSTVKRISMKKKKIEIILVSKAFNGYLNNAGMSIHGDGYIRKSILKRELVNSEEGAAQTVEINSICRDVTGADPTKETGGNEHDQNYIHGSRKHGFRKKCTWRLYVHTGTSRERDRTL